MADSFGMMTDGEMAEYRYECRCGELYREINHAWDCKKCRKYLNEDDYYTRDVIDIVTMKYYNREDDW